MTGGGNVGETGADVLSPEELVEMVEWRATNYIAPHEYVLEHQERELFARMKTKIAREGYDGPFLRKTYRYVNIGSFRYWIVGNVLNRAKLETAGVRRVE